MECGNCDTELESDNYVVIKNNHYCLNCLSTNPCLMNETKSSSTERSQNNTRSMPVRSRLKTKQCQVCFDEKPEKEIKTTYSKRCRHTERTICDDCLYQHVREAFGKMCTDDVHCPELHCGIDFKYHSVQNILSDNKDKGLLEKYDRFVLQRQLERMCEFIWCAHGCGMGQLNDGGDNNNIVTCIKCHKKTCFTHKTEWHQGLRCSEYDAMKNPKHYATQRWIAQNCKKCLKCSCLIEKSDGCDHMTCTNCRYEFCWSCLADYEAIRRDGNHRHNSTCKHYAAYLPFYRTI